VVLNSDALPFGGSGYPVEGIARTEAVPFHGFEHSLTVSLPPLSMLVLVPDTLPDERPAVAATTAKPAPGRKLTKSKKRKAPKE
jgi:1,4-alpha-glucan branching enzyme